MKPCNPPSKALEPLTRPGRTLTACLLAAALGAAQAGEVERRDDCEVQVTAPALPYRQFSKIELTGSSILSAESRQNEPVDVICRRRIDASGASSLPQLLSQWPGLLYRPESASLQTQGGIGPWPAAIHGQAEGTLVLLNGRRLPSFGLQSLVGERSLVDLDMLPLSAVDHIDVMPNGASARYGSDATAGVVNLITRRVITGTTLRVQGRSQGGRLANLVWGNDNSRQTGLRLQAHLEAERQDGLRLGQQPDAVAPGQLSASSANASLQPALERQLLYLESQWALSHEWEAFAQILQGQTRLDSQIDGLFMFSPVSHLTRLHRPAWLQSTPSDERGSRQHQQRAYRQFTSGLRGPWQSWDLTGSFSSAEHWVERTQYPSLNDAAPRGPIDQGTTGLNTIDVLGSRALGERDGQAISLGLGLHWREEAFAYRPWLSGLQALDARRQVSAVHGEWQVPVTAAQQVLLAWRHDHYSDMGGVGTHKLAWRWQASPWLMLRASAGQGFRAPSLSQRSPLQSGGLAVSDPLGGASVNVLLQGNPALGPERTHDASVGVRLDPSRQWTLGADLWTVQARQTFGLLPSQWVLGNPALRAQYLRAGGDGQSVLVLPYQPLGQADRAGIDYEVQWRQPSDFGLVRLEFKGTAYLRSRREAPGSVTAVSDLGQRSTASGTVMPRHQLMLGAQLDRASWHGSVRLYYRHGYKEIWPGQSGPALQAPAHWTLDVVQRWEWGRAMQLTASVHNLFNRIAWAQLDGDGRLALRHPQDMSVQGRQLRLQIEYRF